MRPADVALLPPYLFATLVASSGAAASPTTVKAFNDPYDVPLAPRPPTLPELTHSETESTLEATGGAIVPKGGGAFTHAYVQRLSVEVPLGLRRWYLGAAYEVAAAGGRGVSGNLELDGRTLWATRTGLAFGGGLALVFPTAVFDTRGPAATSALDAASLRPWDVAFFTPSAFGFRPFVDVRAIDGAFVAQFRQGLDVLDSGGSLALYATVGVYLGLWATNKIAAGIEAFEAYALDVMSVDDNNRAGVVVSPNVRLVLPWIEPAISAYTNVGTPLQGGGDRVWGFRLAFTVLYDSTLTFDVRAGAPAKGH